MWKIFITVIAMSDIGSVSTNVAVTDYSSHSDCERTSKEISGKTTQTVGGHNFVIIVTAQCNGDLIPPPPGYRMQR